MPAAAAYSKIQELLGNEAETLLAHECKTISKDNIHLPGPDFVDRVCSQSDRNPRVLRSMQTLFGGYGHRDMGPFRKPRGQTRTMLVRVSRRGEVHATFCGTSCIGGATLSLAPARAGSANVATRPG